MSVSFLCIYAIYFRSSQCPKFHFFLISCVPSINKPYNETVFDSSLPLSFGHELNTSERIRYFFRGSFKQDNLNQTYAIRDAFAVIIGVGFNFNQTVVC